MKFFSWIKYTKKTFFVNIQNEIVKIIFLRIIP